MIYIQSQSLLVSYPKRTYICAAHVRIRECNLARMLTWIASLAHSLSVCLLCFTTKSTLSVSCLMVSSCVCVSQLGDTAVYNSNLTILTSPYMVAIWNFFYIHPSAKPASLWYYSAISKQNASVHTFILWLILDTVQQTQNVIIYRASTASP